MTTAAALPVVALTLGDPAGIGAELIAKLLARPDATSRANLVLIGDRWLWEAGQRIAGVTVDVEPVESLAAALVGRPPRAPRSSRSTRSIPRRSRSASRARPAAALR